MTTRRLLTVATATAFAVGLTTASLFAPPTAAVAAEHGDHAADADDAPGDAHAGHGHAATALTVSDVSLAQAHRSSPRPSKRPRPSTRRWTSRWWMPAAT